MISEISNFTTHDTTPTSRRIPQRKRTGAISLAWNLSDGKAFYPESNCPPAPVLASFGLDRMHMCRMKGHYDYNRAIQEHSDFLIRSYRILEDGKKEEINSYYIFQFGERSFLYGESSSTRIVSYASTREEAEKLVREFSKNYSIASQLEGGTFELIQTDETGISTHSVPLEPETLLGDEIFDLYYPAGFRAWHLAFEEKLRKRKQGLSIFQGQPGTGKTTYLRHLMGRLKTSHRFYFIPPSSMSVLSETNFIGFWAGERQSYPDQKLVVILEDADAALMTRGSDNQEQVSAVLNLTDGMLGDFLRLHIICSINCRASDIDQALLRPGRLITQRKFERLDSEQAQRLASYLCKTLPEKKDYSLAEVFSGEEQESIPQQFVGFGS